ncbi:MAG: sigma-70 family RNA polymerase sigma factor [Actinomycetota bacterium]
MTASTADNPSERTELPPTVVAAFCAGDQAALGSVFDHYGRAVWSVTMSVLRDRALAEDAAQEAFMRAWRGASSFDPTRPLSPWLMTIARRTALDVHRREFRPTRGGHAPEQEVPVNLPGIERAWETWEIRLALEELPDEERQVVAMAHFQGLSHPQIAERLGIPVGTVKSRSFRAHKRLAQLLSHLVDREGGST